MIKYIPWILTAILYSRTFLQLYRSRWEAIDYTHAYFILPVSLLIVWLKRHEMTAALEGTVSASPTGPSQAPLSRNLGGLFLLMAGCLLFIFGWRWDYLFIQAFSLIPLSWGLVYFLYNQAFAKILAFPILYLLLLVPVPLGILDNITLPMRYAASVASAFILKAFHFPVVREGLLITMDTHEIFMGAPCSGFRSLITMISLGLIYIYFNQGSRFKNITLFFSIIPLALLGNLARIIALCLITYYFGEEAGQGFFHNFSGIVVFVIIICGMMGLERILSKG